MGKHSRGAYAFRVQNISPEQLGNKRHVLWDYGGTKQHVPSTRERSGRSSDGAAKRVGVRLQRTRNHILEK